jgi:hypothetical protein
MLYDDRTIDASVDFTCKSCAYFKERALYDGGPCAAIAAKDDDKPCTRFMINPNKWNRAKRSRVLQAMSILHDAGVSVSDLRALFYSADRLPSSHPYGTRWWCAFGSGSTASRICATVIGKNTTGKFTLIADNGAILVVSGEALEPYTTGDVAPALASFDVELPASMKRKQPEKKELKHDTTASGATVIQLRGNEPQAVEFTDVATPKGKLSKTVIAKPAARKSTLKSAKRRR